MSELPSETLGKVLTWIKEWTDAYETCKAVIAEEDAKEQDFLHALEFQDNNKERSKIATVVHASRKRRREAKNQMEMLETVVQFFRREQTKLFIKSLKAMLVTQQKEEERLNSDRIYIPRTAAWNDLHTPARGGDGNDNT